MKINRTPKETSYIIEVAATEIISNPIIKERNKRKEKIGFIAKICKKHHVDTENMIKLLNIKN